MVNKQDWRDEVEKLNLFAVLIIVVTWGRPIISKLHLWHWFCWIYVSLTCTFERIVKVILIQISPLKAMWIIVGSSQRYHSHVSNGLRAGFGRGLWRDESLLYCTVRVLYTTVVISFTVRHLYSTGTYVHNLKVQYSTYVRTYVRTCAEHEVSTVW